VEYEVPEGWVTDLAYAIFAGLLVEFLRAIYEIAVSQIFFGFLYP
jgi:hypothetical protein